MTSTTCADLKPFRDVEWNYNRITTLEGLISIVLLVLSIVGTLIYDDSVGIPYYIGGYITGLFTLCQAAACHNVARHARKEGQEHSDLVTKWMKYQYLFSLADVLACFVSLIIVSIATGKYEDEDHEDSKHYSHNRRLAHTILAFCMFALLVTLYAMVCVCVSGPGHGVHVTNKAVRTAAVEAGPQSRPGINHRPAAMFQAQPLQPTDWSQQPTRQTLPPLNPGHRPVDNAGNQYSSGGNIPRNMAVYDARDQNNVGQRQQSPNNTTGNQPTISLHGQAVNTAGNQPRHEAPPPYSTLDPATLPQNLRQPTAPPPPYGYH